MDEVRLELTEPSGHPQRVRDDVSRLREGLAGFVTASEKELAEALRLLLSATHNLAEGTGAAGLAGLFKLRETLRGKKVAIVISGSNIDSETLRRIVDGKI